MGNQADCPNRIAHSALAPCGWPFTVRFVCFRRVGFLLLGLLLALGVSMPLLVRSSGEASRKRWKEESIPLIARSAEDTNWLTQEITMLTNGAPGPRVIIQGWLSDRLLLMNNGEWLVYKNHCPKQKPHNVKDIFLARGSDGRWYVPFLCRNERSPAGRGGCSSSGPRVICPRIQPAPFRWPL